MPGMTRLHMMSDPHASRTRPPGLATSDQSNRAAPTGAGVVRARTWSSMGRPRPPIAPAALYAAGLVSAGLFIGLNVSDWPGGFLGDFWRDHPIIGSSAGGLLLLATGFFFFDYRDRSTQATLDEKVAAAGRSGVVDHLVEVDVVLSLVCSPWNILDESWGKWAQPDRPLRWLRQHGEARLQTNKHQPSEGDPRSLVTPESVPPEAWRTSLVDQAVRRVSAGIRSWGPVMSRSRAGQQDLIALGEVRIVLLEVQDELSRSGPAVSTATVQQLQARCRVLAWDFERRAGVPNQRSELVEPGLD